jgi:hypothetical protein
MSNGTSNELPELVLENNASCVNNAPMHQLMIESLERDFAQLDHELFERDFAQLDHESLAISFKRLEDEFLVDRHEPKFLEIDFDQLNSEPKPNWFSPELLRDSVVIALAKCFISNKEAYAYAQQIVNSGVEHLLTVEKQQLAAANPTKKRGPKKYVPVHLKDEKYYRRRTRNTQAARRTRKRTKMRTLLEEIATNAMAHGDTVKE